MNAPAPVLGAVRPVFRALACTCVPEARDLDEHAWADADAIAEQFLATRPAAGRRQVVLLIRVLDGQTALHRKGADEENEGVGGRV